MRRPLGSALAEGLNVGLGSPTSAALVTLIGLAATLVATLVDPVAGAIVGAGLFLAAVGLLLFALRQRTLFDGPFVVLEDETIWDLVKRDGSKAVVTKKQRVRFNYPVITLTEYAWGDGDQFEDFDCEYGRALEKVRDGSKQYVIIALPAEKKRGEEAHLVSHRTVRDGFLSESEWIEFGIRHRSHRQTLAVRFPEARPPTELTYRRKSDGRTRQADETTLTNEGARQVFRLSETTPRVGEEYLILWKW